MGSADQGGGHFGDRELRFAARAAMIGINGYHTREHRPLRAPSHVTELRYRTHGRVMRLVLMLQKRITFDRFARFASNSDSPKSFLSVLAEFFLHKWIDTR
jgi:hypothetical protein